MAEATASLDVGRAYAARPDALDPQPADGRRRRRLFALKAAVSAALVIWVAQGAELAEVTDALAAVQPAWLALAIALQFIGVALIALRWGELLKVRGVAPGWRRLFGSALVSTFFRQFLPSTVGGDVIRGYDAWRAGASPGFALTSLVVDRLLGLLALAVVAVAAVAVSDELTARLPQAGLWSEAGLVAVAAAVWLAVAPPAGLLALIEAVLARLPAGLGARLRNIVDALTAFRGARRATAAGFGLSLLLQANVVTFYWTLATALGFEVGYLDFYVIAPIALVVMMAPITINGIGLREGVFVFLLGAWSIGTAEALAFAWLEYGLFLAFGLFGGLIYALRRAV